MEMERSVLINLERALRELSDTGFDVDSIHTLVLLFGQRRGIDQLGRLNLHYADPVANWTASLRLVDMKKVADIKVCFEFFQKFKKNALPWSRTRHFAATTRCNADLLEGRAGDNARVKLGLYLTQMYIVFTFLLVMEG